jgi:hypothetical protein
MKGPAGKDGQDGQDGNDGADGADGSDSANKEYIYFRGLGEEDTPSKPIAEGGEDTSVDNFVPKKKYTSKVDGTVELS